MAGREARGSRAFRCDGLGLAGRPGAVDRRRKRKQDQAHLPAKRVSLAPFGLPFDFGPVGLRSGRTGY